MTEPVFEMPACWRHFFKGHRWWCRACDRETESQFREVCEALWALQRKAKQRVDEWGLLE